MSKVWIGLAHVVPNQNCTLLGKARSAFVNVLVFANNRKDYCDLATRSLNGCNFIIKKFEDVEPMENRLQNHDVDKQVLLLSNKVSSSNPVEFSSFHTYDLE